MVVDYVSNLECRSRSIVCSCVEETEGGIVKRNLTAFKKHAIEPASTEVALAVHYTDSAFVDERLAGEPIRKALAEYPTATVITEYQVLEGLLKEFVEKNPRLLVGSIIRITIEGA